MPDNLADLVVQFFGLFLLCLGLYLSYRWWVKPYAASLDWQGQGALLLVILTMIGGAVGSTGWFADDPRSFSWDLPPLASRMLGGAGWAFAVLCWQALRRPHWRRVRLVLVALLIYLAPIDLAVVLFHLDRFDFAAPITYGFFLIAVGMAVAATWYLLRPPLSLVQALPQPGNTPVSRLRKTVLALTSALTLPWALALFMTDQGLTRLVWAWPGDLLTSRLIAVMLLTIGVGSLLSLTSDDTARMMLAMNLTYGLGVAVAGMVNVLLGKPLPWGYVLVFSVLALVSTIALVAERKTTPSLRPSRTQKLSFDSPLRPTICQTSYRMVATRAPPQPKFGSLD